MSIVKAMKGKKRKEYSDIDIEQLLAILHRRQLIKLDSPLPLIDE